MGVLWCGHLVHSKACAPLVEDIAKQFRRPSTESTYFNIMRGNLLEDQKSNFLGFLARYVLHIYYRRTSDYKVHG